MAKVKHLHEIKGRFAVRVGVPASLRGFVFAGGAGSELREWLGTDRKAAERAAPEMVARFYRRIDEAKHQLAAATPTLGTAAKHHYAAELIIDDRERTGRGSEWVQQARAISAPIVASKLRGFLAGNVSDEEAEAIVGYAANGALTAGAASPDLNRRELLLAMAEVQLEVLARQQERDAGQVAPSQPKSEFLKPEATPELLNVPSRPAAAQSGETIGVNGGVKTGQ